MVLFLEGVGLHVRDDELKRCLRRHLEWLDEIIVTVDDSTWHRWTTTRQTMKGQVGRNQFVADDDCMVVGGANVGQKRRMDFNVRKQMAQNVLRTAAKRRRGSAMPAAPSLQRGGMLPTSTQRARMPALRGMRAPNFMRSTPQKLSPGGQVLSQGAPRLPMPVARIPVPPTQQQQQRMMQAPNMSVNNSALPSPSHSSSSSTSVNIPQSSVIPSSTQTLMTPPLPLPSGGIDVENADNSTQFSVVDNSGQEIFSSEEIESTLKSIKDSINDSNTGSAFIDPKIERSSSDEQRGTHEAIAQGSHDLELSVDNQDTSENHSDDSTGTVLYQPKCEDGDEEVDDDPVEIIKVEPRSSDDNNYMMDNSQQSPGMLQVAPSMSDHMMAGPSQATGFLGNDHDLSSLWLPAGYLGARYNDKFVCRICNKECASNYNLKRHVVVQHLTKGKSYTCHVCQAQYTRLDTLKSHVRRVHVLDEVVDVSGPLYNTEAFDGGGGSIEDR